MIGWGDWGNQGYMVVGSLTFSEENIIFSTPVTTPWKMDILIDNYDHKIHKNIKTVIIVYYTFYSLFYVPFVEFSIKCFSDFFSTYPT